MKQVDGMILPLLLGLAWVSLNGFIVALRARCIYTIGAALVAPLLIKRGES
ncbi:MAG: hypothetical protein ACXW04_00115 [Methylobacter sp.]